MSPLTSVSASRSPDRFESLWTYATDKSTLPSASSSPPTCWPKWSSPTEAYHLSGGDFSLSQEGIMKIRWALFSAAILIGFLPSQVTSEEAILGQGNISCGSWIEIAGMTILLQRPEPPGF